MITFLILQQHRKRKKWKIKKREITQKERQKIIIYSEQFSTILYVTFSFVTGFKLSRDIQFILISSNLKYFHNLFSSSSEVKSFNVLISIFSSIKYRSSSDHIDHQRQKVGKHSFSSIS